MAEFKLELPKEIIKELDSLNKSSEKMFGEMTRAGAKKVYANVVNNVPPSFKKSKIMNCLKVTKTYKTPLDGGINTKVAFYGYFLNEENKLTSAPLVCNVFEFGRSTSKFPRHKFMKKSLNEKEIERVMLDTQNKYIKDK